MSGLLKGVAILVPLATFLSCGAVCAPEKTRTVPAAPIPSQILTAKKVFIANGGGDESRFDAPSFSGGPDRLYNEFHAAIKSWGRYELVSTPAEAELVFEVSLTVVRGQKTGLHSSDVDAYDPQFRLTVRDVQTHTTLWGLTEHAQPAILQDNRDKNFENALYWMVFELKKIAGATSGAGSTAAPPGN